MYNENDYTSKEAIKNIVGENVRRERMLRNLSMEELANMTGRTIGFIGLIERGKRGVTAELLAKFAEVFNISADKLLQPRDCEAVEEAVPRDSEISNNTSGITISRATINSLLYDANEKELSFIISVIRSMKKMHDTDIE